MSYFPKPEKNENDLAIILREDVATRSVAEGQYVSWRGRTGKAKADIQQGDSLSVGLFDYDEDGALNAVIDALPKIIATGMMNGSVRVTIPSDGLYMVLFNNYSGNSQYLGVVINEEAIRTVVNDDGASGNGNPAGYYVGYMSEGDVIRFTTSKSWYTSSPIYTNYTVVRLSGIVQQV